MVVPALGPDHDVAHAVAVEVADGVHAVAVQLAVAAHRAAVEVVEAGVVLPEDGRRAPPVAVHAEREVVARGEHEVGLAVAREVARHHDRRDLAVVERGVGVVGRGEAPQRVAAVEVGEDAVAGERDDGAAPVRVVGDDEGVGAVGLDGGGPELDLDLYGVERGERDRQRAPDDREGRVVRPHLGDDEGLGAFVHDAERPAARALGRARGLGREG